MGGREQKLMKVVWERLQGGKYYTCLSKSREKCYILGYKGESNKNVTFKS